MNNKIQYESCIRNYTTIPGNPIAYWVSDQLVKSFNHELLFKYSISPSQNITGNNERFIRKWWEIFDDKINKPDLWIFYAKGGGFRKWWGNLDDVINWTPEARYIYKNGDGLHASQIINRDYWYKKAITWGLITSSIPSFRIMPEGATFDKGGSSIIVDEEYYNFVLSLLNSKVYLEIVSILNPTLNYQVKDIRNLPLNILHKESVDKLAMFNIECCEKDWNSYETSWEFEKHPLI